MPEITLGADVVSVSAALLAQSALLTLYQDQEVIDLTGAPLTGQQLQRIDACLGAAAVPTGELMGLLPVCDYLGLTEVYWRWIEQLAAAIYREPLALVLPADIILDVERSLRRYYRCHRVIGESVAVFSPDLEMFLPEMEVERTRQIAFYRWGEEGWQLSKMYYNLTDGELVVEAGKQRWTYQLPRPNYYRVARNGERLLVGHSTSTLPVVIDLGTGRHWPWPHPSITWSYLDPDLRYMVEGKSFYAVDRAEVWTLQAGWTDPLKGHCSSHVCSPDGRYLLQARVHYSSICTDKYQGQIVDLQQRTAQALPEELMRGTISGPECGGRVFNSMFIGELFHCLRIMTEQGTNILALTDDRLLWARDKVICAWPLTADLGAIRWESGMVVYCDAVPIQQIHCGRGGVLIKTMDRVCKVLRPAQL